MDFENANLSGYSPGSAVPIANALPNWIGYSESANFGIQPVSQVGYDTIDLGGGGIFIIDTNVFGLSPIQGTYSVFLHGSSAAGQYSFSIGQTGEIPISAQSLIFYGGDDTVSFNGQPLSIVLLGIGSNPDYNIYGADVSKFAGQTGQLLFTALANSGAFLDNIQFSATSIPEPSVLGLFALGVLLFVCRRKGVSSYY